MTTRLLLAKRINNGQSETWLDAELEKRIVVATNGILHPALINSTVEEFDQSFAAGPTVLPHPVASVLIAEFKL